MNNPHPYDYDERAEWIGVDRLPTDGTDQQGIGARGRAYAHETTTTITHDKE